MKGISLTIEILNLLKSNKKVTTKLISEELGVSVRTAQRYMAELLNIPGLLYYDTDSHTYSLLENVKFTDVNLPKTEMKFLAALLEYIKKFVTPKTKTHIDKILKRILHINSVEAVKFINNPKYINVDNIMDTLSFIDDAIKHRQEIEFYYEKYGKKYNVTPLCILIDNGFWYLLAKHENTLKKFSIDLIRDVNILMKFFKISQQEIDELINNANSIWFEEKEKIKVSAEIDSEVAFYFKRKEIFPLQKIEKELDNGNILLTFHVSNEEEFLYFVRPWAEYIKIKEPAEYITIIKKFAENILKKYSKNL
jgi:predicted DNA-binding transcriptional regulator YafY